MAIELDALADDRRVAAETALPQGEAEHRDGMRAGRAVFFGAEETAQRGLHAERGKIIARNHHAVSWFRLPVQVEAKWRFTPRQQFGEDLVATAIVQIIRVRN